MNSKQSNIDKEIINRTLIVSYFLIFLLVFMMMFIIKALFFEYDATDAQSFEDYTGSIHVGIDTIAGDYKISSTSNESGDKVYGVRNNEDAPFTVMTYTNNQIIQVKNGQHYIFYKTDVDPVDEQQHTQATAQIDNKIGEATGKPVTSEVGKNIENGMIKLTNDYYNVPYVLSSSGENSYVELYDRNLNVTNLIPITSEILYTITPNEASYIKTNNVISAPLSSYKTTGKMVDGHFTPAVYVGGTNIESGEFLLQQDGDYCKYRIIDDHEKVNSTPFSSCSQDATLVTLEDQQIIEFHDAKLEKYFGTVDEETYQKTSDES